MLMRLLSSEYAWYGHLAPFVRSLHMKFGWRTIHCSGPFLSLFHLDLRYIINPLRASFFRYLCIVFVSKNLHFPNFVRHSFAQISRSWGSIFLSFVYSFITSALLVCLYFLYNALHMRCILLREFRYVVLSSGGLLRINPSGNWKIACLIITWEDKSSM
jgi:hypothetical protein